MTLSPLFQLECSPIELDDLLHCVVFSCLQWKNPNLDVMEKAVNQRLAVLYHPPLDRSYIIETLNRAHIHGAMSGVKLIAAHKNGLYLFLSNEVASSTLPTIEALWATVTQSDRNPRLRVDFASENEVYSGRSDYPFWPVVKGILESKHFGMEQYDPKSPGCSSDNEIDDDAGFEPSTRDFGLCIRTGQNIQAPHTECKLCPKAGKLQSNWILKDFPHHPTQMSHEKLKTSAKAVEHMAMRDDCVYALMAEDFQASELRFVRAGDVVLIQSQVRVRIGVSPYNGKTRQVTVSENVGSLLRKYIVERGLSDRAFLFQSFRNPKIPMSIMHMKKIFYSRPVGTNKISLQTSDAAIQPFVAADVWQP